MLPTKFPLYILDENTKVSFMIHKYSVHTHNIHTQSTPILRTGGSTNVSFTNYLQIGARGLRRQAAHPVIYAILYPAYTVHRITIYPIIIHLH